MMQGETYVKERQISTMSFNLKYINHLYDTAQAIDCSIDTEQDYKAAVCMKAFTAVVDFIYKLVIGQNEIVQLVSLTLPCIKELDLPHFENSQYKMHVVTPGSFHTRMNSEILIEGWASPQWLHV